MLTGGDESLATSLEPRVKDRPSVARLTRPVLHTARATLTRAPDTPGCREHQAGLHESGGKLLLRSVACFQKPRNRALLQKAGNGLHPIGAPARRDATGTLEDIHAAR